MNLPTQSRQVRLVVMALLLAGVLLLGLNPAAWATPAQNPAGQTVPTKTPKPTNTPRPTSTPRPITPPPGTKLNLSDISCVGHNVRVHFVVVQLPNNVTNYGVVTYMVNGTTRTATFDRRTGSTAHYSDIIPMAQRPTNGLYNVTSGSVTITTTTGSFTLQLHNPGTFRATCSRPESHVAVRVSVHPY